MLAWRMGVRDLQMELGRGRGRAVSRRWREAGPGGGGRPCLSLLGTSPHLPHPHHTSSTEPLEAMMPRTREGLGCHPSTHHAPGPRRWGLFLLGTLSSKGLASAEPSQGGGLPSLLPRHGEQLRTCPPGGPALPTPHQDPHL